MLVRISLILTLFLCTQFVHGQTDIDSLPVLSAQTAPTSEADFLIEEPERQAQALRSQDGRFLYLDNGIIRRTFMLEPAVGCISLQNLQTGQELIRSVRPEASVTINGATYAVGGLHGQPNHAFLKEAWLDDLEADPNALQLEQIAVGEPQARFAWKRVRHHSPFAQWPPHGVSIRMDYRLPASADADLREAVTVSVHYELYDGIPAMSKWLTVNNQGGETITVDRFTSEVLAVVEEVSWVEAREDDYMPPPSWLHVETDFAFGGFTFREANVHVVHWREDPLYQTQVNYRRLTPCLLEVEPTYGPAQDIEPGGIFASYRTFELVYDSSDRERRGLTLRKMYRTLAPWVTENPLMHHMRLSDPEEVRRAIDDAAEVGFEMIILSFGSGFHIESEDPEYIQQWKEIADYARQKGIEIGGYSLLSSRSIGGGNDIVSPPGQRPTHGNCPALTSEWGQEYFRKLYAFFQETGFMLLEHDGSYPGDVDVTARPPLQKGIQDSRWVQWQIITDFYQWCRSQGIYLNVPDYYYLSGTNKSGMGYRETNWSLPRAHQVIHTRQNIFDGTWEKTPSMGWMFVPLTEYHGGGAAATIEPLNEHLDHYERMITANLGLGVQACYRGPRLFDTDRTKQMVAKWVDWYKQYRDILESDIIHGRRADARGLDWMLNVNPRLENKGLLSVFNPLNETIETTIEVDLYYTGIKEEAVVLLQGENPQRHTLGRDDTIELPVRIAPQGYAWYLIRENE